MSYKGRKGLRVSMRALPLVVGVIFISLAYADTASTKKSEETGISVYDNYYDVATTSPQEAWIVGYEGKILHTADGGKSWERQKGNTDLSLFSVSFKDRQNGFITGAEGTILLTQDGGQTWQRKKSPTTEHLLSGYYADPQNLWAVGERGTIVHSPDGGNTWEERSLKEDAILNKVYFFDNLHGWIVGEFGKILHTSDAGQTWTPQSNLVGIPKDPMLTTYGYTIYLYDVRFIDIKRGWVTGAAGTVLYTEDGGETWTKIPTNINQPLFSVGMAKEILAIGSVGTVLASKINPHLNQWQLRKDIVVFNWLRGIDFCKEDYGWIVGGRGTVLKSTDGGQRWEILQPGQ